MESTKKSKKGIIKIVAFVISFLVIGLGGYLLGYQNAPEKVITIREDSEGKIEITADKEKRVNTDTIAIVNSDQGTIVGEENINYASRLLNSLEEEFVLENIEAAKKGIGDGTYAAYIVIPSNFSECVVSLNTYPVQAKLEYAVNQNLLEERKVETVYRINDLERHLNSGMSYMYISSILSEFHKVQDDAQVIMEHDERDKQILLAVQPSDLVALIPVPEMDRVDNSIEPLDVTKYNQANQEAVADISESYFYFISLGESDLQVLNDQGTNLVAQWSQMEGVLNNISITTDEDGNLLYSDGVSSISGILTTYNETYLSGKESIIEQTLLGIKGSIDQCSSDLSNLILTYNTNRKNAYPDAVQLISANLSAAMTPQFNNNVTNGLTLDQEPPVQLTYNASRDIEVQNNLQSIQNYIQAVNTMIAGSSDAVLTTAYANYVAADVDLNAVITELNQGDNPFSPEVDLQQLQADLQNAIDQAMLMRSPDQNVIEQILLNEIPDFTDTTNGGTTITDVLNAISNGIQGDVNLQTTQKVDKVDINTVMDEVSNKIVLPLDQKAGVIKNDLLQQYGLEKTELGKYSQAVNGYNPLSHIDQSVIQGYINNIGSNNMEIQTTVTQNYSDNMEYVSQVWQTSEENVNALQKNIQEAKEASDHAVSAGLENAKNLKEETSATNQMLLKSFTEKLPYTRIGNLDNTTTYKFMTDPVALNGMDIGQFESPDLEKPEEPETKKVTSNIKTEKIDKTDHVLFYILLFLSAVLVVLVGAASFLAIKRKRVGKRKIH